MMILLYHNDFHKKNLQGYLKFIMNQQKNMPLKQV